MLRSGVVGLGAIVASDVDPDRRARGSAFFAPAGGAMLLSRDDSADECTDFCTETFPEYADLFVSGLVWQQRRAHGGRAGGRSQMIVEERPGYHERLVDCAAESVRRFLDRLEMSIGDIDLLVPAPWYADFCDPLRPRLGIPGDRVANVPEDLEGAYPAGPIAALQAAIRPGRLGRARTTLVLAAGAGITVALALYVQPAAG